MSIPRIFNLDYERYEGVRPISVHLMRVLFLLMFLGVGYDSWSMLVTHRGPWDPIRSVAWCMFGSYSMLSIIGVFRPLKMLPIVLFMIVYKSTWLIVVAYPLWAANRLAGSPAEEMANIFVWIPVVIVAMPWKYVFYNYVLNRKM